jgi:hypothetical protein
MAPPTGGAGSAGETTARGDVDLLPSRCDSQAAGAVLGRAESRVRVPCTFGRRTGSGGNTPGSAVNRSGAATGTAGAATAAGAPAPIDGAGTSDGAAAGAPTTEGGTGTGTASTPGPAT